MNIFWAHHRPNLRVWRPDRLRTALVHLFENPPPGLHDISSGRPELRKIFISDCSARYEGQPIQLVNEMFAAPNPDYFNVMWNLPDLSGQITDRMFLSASLAFIHNHPLAVAGYVWDNLVDFTVGPSGMSGHTVERGAVRKWGPSFILHCRMR